MKNIWKIREIIYKIYTIYKSIKWAIESKKCNIIGSFLESSIIFFRGSFNDWESLSFTTHSVSSFFIKKESIF